MRGNKIIIEDEEVMLLVKIIGTIGVTTGRPYQYKVEAWTNVSDKHETMVVPTEGDPEFNEELLIPQNKDQPAEFLYVDVFKTNSAGTSLVGRGVTLLPTVKGIDIHSDVDLFGCEETGFLQLSLNLMDCERLAYVSI